VPFLLRWPAVERVLQSEETNASLPISIAHDVRHPKRWLTPNGSLGTGYVQGDYHGSFVYATVMFAQRTHVEHYQREDQ
jgi:hypothetical protein